MLYFTLRQDLGLGTLINTISFLENLNSDIFLYVSSENNYVNYKVLFDNLRLNNNYFVDLNKNIVMNKGIYLLLLTETCKFFNKYPTLNNIKKYKKGIIGLSFYSTSKALSNPVFDLPIKEFNSKLLTFPFCKFVSHKHKELIKKHFELLNYVVLDFDDYVFHDNLYNKINLLKHIDLLVTYEGGLAHLCHCLNIPTIIWKWNSFLNNENFFNTLDYENCYIKETDYERVEDSMLHIQSLHLSKTSLFINKIDELLNCSKKDIDIIIDSLYAKEGNNIFLKNTFNVNSIKEYKSSKWPVIKQKIDDPFIVELIGEIQNKPFSFIIDKKMYDFLKRNKNVLKVGDEVPINFNVENL